ncbi:unannotated protein [freshwater metagenome]|uniref:Unannotated protein n=1 Tax=freshwater metagenome TaxID=449393 RepID=A0A6J7DKY4_9ZZZZ
MGFLVIVIAISLVGAWQYRWICDDAMINFHIVDNFVHGHGPVFNVGERTEVYSDPLWVAALIVMRIALWFVPLGWSALLLGLGFSALGFYFAGRAIAWQNRGSIPTAWPVGLATLAVIPPVWEFMTSGLEIGMTIAWIGASYYLVVRRHSNVGSPTRAAFLLGLGVLIRPDLLILVLWFLATWFITDQSWFMSTTQRVRRFFLAGIFAFSLPVLYELFRMAYFASLVPNTGLVKSATSLWISQGLSYLLNFFNPYWLWIPVGVLVLLQISRGFAVRDDRRTAFVTLSPLIGGLLLMGYFVVIGGDFMHGRLLIPGLFCLLMNGSLNLATRWRIALLVVIAAWVVVCASLLRWTESPLLYTTIGDERIITLGLSGVDHPITQNDFASSKWFGYGQQLRIGAEQYAPGRDGLVLGSNPRVFVALPSHLPPIVGGRNGLGNVLIAATRPIGQVGYAAGQRVYIFDELSLANPVSSHFTVHLRGKPGHEKVASMAWYLARFGTPGDAGQLNRYRRISNFEKVLPADVVAARDALACGELRTYLRGITAPLTPRLLVSNVLHSFANTTMKFDANPVVARTELCKPH